MITWAHSNCLQRSVFQPGESKRSLLHLSHKWTAGAGFPFETVAFFFTIANPPPKKKETQNNRRLESVWYKHALFRVINRFNLEEDTGLRRKHAILEVLKHSPRSVFQRKPFDSQSSNPTEAGRLFWIGFLLVLHRPDTPEVTNVSIWLCSPVWAILLPFVFVGQGHPSKKIAWNGQWTIRWGEGGTLGNKIRGQRSGFTGSGVW